MAEFLVISCSLNPQSRSRILAQAAYDALGKHAKAEFIDLRDYDLPVCDGNAAYKHPSLPELTEKIRTASGILLAVPIYNYAVASVAKNLIELTGESWDDKLVGFLCAAGGRMAYMGVLGLANSLMLDFRCLIIPRFVYAEGSLFTETELQDETIKQRIEELAVTAVRINKGLKAKDPVR